MRQGSPNNFSTPDLDQGSRSAKSDAKSLSRNILAASPSKSIFCPDPILSQTHKLLRMRTLSDPKKNSGGGWIDMWTPRGQSPKASRRRPGAPFLASFARSGDLREKSNLGPCDGSARKDAPSIPPQSQRCGSCSPCSANRPPATSLHKTPGQALPPAASTPTE